MHLQYRELPKAYSLMQACAARPIPVLPQHTFPGNVILSSRATSGLSPPVNPDPELEKLSLAHITAASRNIFAALDSTPERGAAARGDDEEQDSFVGKLSGYSSPILRSLYVDSGKGEENFAY